MTRKDYEAIAVAICRAREAGYNLGQGAGPDDAIDLVVDEVAHVFALDNKLFNKALFVEACTL
jgi:hypothetical protein